ncbi:MAG: sugar-binding domain-containing protein [Mangrovibacterium sp.]
MGIRSFHSILFLCMPLLLPFFIQSSFGQELQVRQQELTQFELQYSGLIRGTGEELSDPDYRPAIHWFPVRVPSTVLTGLVANRVYPDPYTGMNNMLIPDASDRFNRKYGLERYSHLPGTDNPWKKPYWYRTVFDVPATEAGSHVQLIFKGINYRAAVWLNGKQLTDSSDMAGMFAQYSLDVSKCIRAGGKNALAVKIYPLDESGYPAPEQLKALGDFYANGGPTGDIGKNVTMLCSAGWDWMPPVRDRNMGIWQPIFLRCTGQLTLSYPHLISHLPLLPDTALSELSISVGLTNHQSFPVRGKLLVDIRPENFVGEPLRFAKEIELAAASTTELCMNPKNSAGLSIKNPALWWPNGYGKPSLYRIRLRLEQEGKLSDDTTFLFGIRTVSSRTVQEKGKFLRRDFYVNGRRIHLNGGAWVPDMMLNRDSLRYALELDLCRRSRINLVRIWGGGITPPDVFFDLADRKGLLIWSDFWITGDTHGEFKGSAHWPLEPEVFKQNVTGTILRIRNHPSLLVWTGGNEGHARKELYDFMRNRIAGLDGTRPFIPSSSGFAALPRGWKKSWPDNADPGVYSGGPYRWMDPKQYYKLVEEGKDWVFKDETGLPSQPPYNSLKKLIPNLVWDPSLPFPLNHSWGYHDAATGNGRYDLYYDEMVSRYGKPESMNDFSMKMQLMNAVAYQAIFESAGASLNRTGGVMLWKLNAAFPSVIWQIYDWYLNPNAGYYSMRNALEPVHVQLNPVNCRVVGVNRTYHSLDTLTVEAEVYDASACLLHLQRGKAVMQANQVLEFFPLDSVLQRQTDVCLVLLRLKDRHGRIISRNMSWLSDDDRYLSLNDMPPAQVETAVLAIRQDRTEKTWTLRVTNTSDKLAFFVNPRLLDQGEEVMPSFWSANYFSLAPGESVTLTVSAPRCLLKAANQEIELEGWNLK